MSYRRAQSICNQLIGCPLWALRVIGADAATALSKANATIEDGPKLPFEFGFCSVSFETWIDPQLDQPQVIGKSCSTKSLEQCFRLASDVLIQSNEWIFYYLN